jgi:ribonucleotide reductase alpha subunit
MCPKECPGLDDVWGIEFEDLYMQVRDWTERGRKTIPAQKIWQMISDCQIQTGNPYIVLQGCS